MFISLFHCPEEFNWRVVVIHIYDYHIDYNSDFPLQFVNPTNSHVMRMQNVYRWDGCVTGSTTATTRLMNTTARSKGRVRPVVLRFSKGERRQEHFEMVVKS